MVVVLCTLLAACATGAPRGSEAVLPVTDGRIWSTTDAMHWTVRADVHALRTEDREPDAPRRFGTLQAMGDSTVVPVWLETRGVFRLDPDNCSFPQLRISVATDSIEGDRPPWTRRLGRARMTTPCRRGHDDFVWLEYLAYRIRNLLGVESFLVRPVVVNFVDDSGRDDPYEAWTFIRESNGRFERRVGLTEVPDSVLPVVDPRVVEPVTGALNDAFEFMIGHTDWSIAARHNLFMATDSLGRLFAVPYDFDFAGIVDAPYAVPDSRLPINEVTTRLYRGMCRPNAAYKAALDTIRDREDEIMGLLDELTGLSGGRRARARAYLREFFSDLSRGDFLERSFQYTCLRPG